MRCKNCGWPNKPQTSVCVKCGQPLSAEPSGMPTSAPGMPGGADSLNKTVMESAVFEGPSAAPAYEPAPTVNQDDTKLCSKCGYPLRPGVDKCPNCKFPTGEQRQAPNEIHGNDAGVGGQRRPTRISGESKKSGGTPLRGTVNPYMMSVDVEPTFVLKPVKRMNEHRDLDEVEFEGSEVVLTRDNTEPKNTSITSQEQAVITKTGGHWYIEDRSEQKTTFVQAGSKIELHDGDIILMGNRLFIFNEQ